jgi:hypothetical protein
MRDQGLAPKSPVLDFLIPSIFQTPPREGHRGLEVGCEWELRRQEIAGYIEINMKY